MNSRFLLGLAILAIAVAPLSAQSAIPGLCPTGYAAYAGGACGALLTPSNPDGNYTYSYTYGASSPSDVPGVVLSSDNLLVAGDFSLGSPPESWYTLGSGQWISTSDSTAPIPGGGPGQDVTVNYAINFDLTGFDLSTVSITGSWTADDMGLGLFVNGNAVAGSALPNSSDSGTPPDQPWAYTYSFTINSSTPGITFNQGANTLVFSVDQADNLYDGLLVDSLSGTANPANETPEPGSFLLIGAGLGMVALRRRRA
jgi:hypothetical protein